MAKGKGIPAHAKPPGPGGHGHKGDRNAPKLPPIKGPGKSNQLPAKKK